MDKRNDILIKLDNYNPESLEEQGSKILMLDFIENNKNCFQRENLEGHVTASSWIVNPDRTKVCLVHHKKLKRWMQAGGHCDGEFRTKLVAQKELEEETGLKTAELVSDKLFDIDAHVIPDHKNVPEHIHYDVRFLFEADDNENPVVSDESNDVKWFTLEEAEKLELDDSVLRMLEKTYAIQ